MWLQHTETPTRCPKTRRTPRGQPNSLDACRNFSCSVSTCLYLTVSGRDQQNSSHLFPNQYVPKRGGSRNGGQVCICRGCDAAAAAPWWGSENLSRAALPPNVPLDSSWQQSLAHEIPCNCKILLINWFENWFLLLQSDHHWEKHCEVLPCGLSRCDHRPASPRDPWLSLMLTFCWQC